MGASFFDGPSPNAVSAAPSLSPWTRPSRPAPLTPSDAAALPPPAGAGAPAVPSDLARAGSRLGFESQRAALPSRAAQDAFSFAVIGDAEPGRFVWERLFSPGRDAFRSLLRLAQAAGPDFILQLGDFVSQGNPARYRGYVFLLDKERRLPLFHTVGNHDRSRPNGEADKSLFEAVFGPRDYWFEHGGWRFICLDSSDRRLTPAQLAWFAAALDSPARKVVFTHVPPEYLRRVEPLEAVRALYLRSGEVGTLGLKDYLRDFFTNYFKEGSVEFEALVSRSGVASVYMGHIHSFWAADHRGVRYVISGGGGSPLYPLPPGYPKKRFTHHLSVRAEGGRLRESVFPMGGRPFELPPAR